MRSLVLATVVGTAVLLAACGDSYVVPSEAMLPTYEVGEEITVDLSAYDEEDPALGDAVIFHPPLGGEVGKCGAPHRRGQACPRPTPQLSDQEFLKRIVAGPGDTLSIVDGHPVVNGEPTEEDYIVACSGCNMPVEITSPPGHYFMLGDNRPASDDSRFWGPVPREAILGRVED